MLMVQVQQEKYTEALELLGESQPFQPGGKLSSDCR
jgi:hypothetical protein